MKPRFRGLKKFLGSFGRRKAKEKTKKPIKSSLSREQVVDLVWKKMREENPDLPRSVVDEISKEYPEHEPARLEYIVEIRQMAGVIEKRGLKGMPPPSKYAKDRFF